MSKDEQGRERLRQNEEREARRIAQEGEEIHEESER